MRLLTALEERLAARGGRVGDVAEHARSVRRRAEEDRVAIIAAGLAFYVLLALIPAVVATVAVYAWVRDPAQLYRRIESWTQSFPDEVQRLLAGQLIEVAGMSGTSMGASLAVSILATFWAASKAARAVMTTLNVAYGVDDDRHAVRRRGIAVAVATAVIILTVVALALVDTGASTAGSWWSTASSLLFWPAVVLAQAAMSALAYRYAPNRHGETSHRVLPGTVVSALVFVVATAALAVYVGTADIGRAYGSLGAFVGGGLWLLAISWGLLFGGYVNVEFEAPDGETGETRSRVPAGVEG
ncbi:MAG: YihY/virulence factor BrkB family protein [Actinobacteria bacterium]|nr:YihY/virulence factor BrkB family protein [Actinomycetota bacterium]